MQLKMDLHVHTNYSDSRSTVHDVVRAAKQRGLDGLAITDHETTAGAIAAAKEDTGLIVIPGIEVKTREGHVLGLGVDDHPHTSLHKSSIFDVAQAIWRMGGIVVIPHPYAPFFSTKREVIERLIPDAIEVLNALSPFVRYGRSRSAKLADRLGVAQVAGSDSHASQTVGDAYTLIDAASTTVADILQAIREGKTHVCGSASAWKYRTHFPHFLSIQALSARLHNDR